MHIEKIDFKIVNGITLIALTITIILILILSGTIFGLLLGSNGIINRAALAIKEQEVAVIKEMINLELEFDGSEIRNVQYMNTEEVEKITQGNNRKYINQIGVYRGQLIYLGEEKSEEAIFLKDRGFEVINMTSEDLKYYIELGILEDAINENENICKFLHR